MVTTTSRSTLQPISVATNSAVSKSMVWLIEAMTPFLSRVLMTSVAVFFMREASSPTVISSGTFTVSGVFLMTSRRRRRIFSCSSLRCFEPKAGFLPPLVLFLFLLAIFCLPPEKFCARSEMSTSTRSSKRSALTVTAEVSTTRRSRLRCSCWGLAALSALCAAGAAFAAGALPCAGWAAGFGASAFFGSGFFACGATANTCSSEAIWCFCVITSNTTFSCSSVSTCVLLRGFSKYFPTISAISFGVTPKSAATSFTRYFTKLIFSPPPD